MNNSKSRAANLKDVSRAVFGLRTSRFLLVAALAIIATDLLLVLPAYAQSEDEPLTASFLAYTGPSNHEGAGQTFTIRIQFSEDIDTGYAALRDQALQVEGGVARKFKRVDGGNSLWEIHVEPGSDAAVTLTLPATTEPPDEPTGLEASAASGVGVTLVWDDPADDGITGYEVLRRDLAVHEAGQFETIESDTGSAATTWVDATVKAGGGYVYRVKAINGSGARVRSGHARIDVPEDYEPPEPVATGGTVTPPDEPVALGAQGDDLDYTHYPDFNLHSDNTSPLSIWSDGETVWIGDDADTYIYAYHLRDNPDTGDATEKYGSRDSAKGFDVGVTDDTSRISGDGTHFWVADNTLD